MRRETDTTLTLSETSLTTQISSLSRGVTETGSTPTGISAMRKGLNGCVTSNTESRVSGVLTAKSRVPSGERLMGRVCLPSKLTYEFWARAKLWATTSIRAQVKRTGELNEYIRQV